MEEKKCKVAVIGAGRMGSVVGRQLPGFAEKLMIDVDEEKAEMCAREIGGSASAKLSDAADADFVALVLPAPAIPAASAELAGWMKPGAVLMNMATAGTIDPALREAHPDLHIVDCKIIGNAMAISQTNAPSGVIVGTEDPALFEKIAGILPGYTKVIQGDASLVPVLNGIATKEALRCGFRIQSLLRPYGLPEDLTKILMYTVGGGTLQAQAVGELGGYSRKLIEELRSEGAID